MTIDIGYNSHDFFNVSDRLLFAPSVRHSAGHMMSARLSYPDDIKEFDWRIGEIMFAHRNGGLVEVDESGDSVIDDNGEYVRTPVEWTITVANHCLLRDGSGFSNEPVALGGVDVTGWTIIRETGPYYCNIYLADQAYGGPEEGGWWYEYGTPHDCWRFDGYIAAMEWRRTVGEPLIEKMNKGRRPMHSVLSEGRYTLCMETTLPHPYPAKRPHYE